MEENKKQKETQKEEERKPFDIAAASTEISDDIIFDKNITDHKLRELYSPFLPMNLK